MTEKPEDYDPQTEILNKLDEISDLIVEQIEQNKTLIELITQGSIPLPPPEKRPIYSDGTGTRNVQMTETTRTRIPFVKDGEIKYNDAGIMRLAKPVSNMKVYVGEIYIVWRPFVQVDGTRAYELYDYPGQFLIERQIKRL